MYQSPVKACGTRDQDYTAPQRVGDELLQHVASQLLYIDQLYKQCQADPNAAPGEVLAQLQHLRSAFLGLLDEQLCRIAPPWLDTKPKPCAPKVIVPPVTPPTSGLPPPSKSRPPISVQLAVYEQQLSDLLDQQPSLSLPGNTVCKGAAFKDQAARAQDTDTNKHSADQAQGRLLEASSPFVSGQFVCLQAEPNLCQSSRAAELDPDSGLAKLETFLHQDPANAPRQKPVKLSIASRQPSFRERVAAAENSVLEAEIDAIKEDSLGEQLAAHSSRDSLSGAASAFSDTASAPASPTGNFNKNQASGSQADMSEPALHNGPARSSSKSPSGRLEVNRPPSIQCPHSPTASSPRPAPAPAGPIVPPLALPPREHAPIQPAQLQGVHSSSGLSDKSDQSRGPSRKTSYTEFGRPAPRPADTGYGLDDRDQLGPLQRAMARNTHSRAGTNSGSGVAPTMHQHHIGSDGMWSTTSASAMVSAAVSRRASDEAAHALSDGGASGNTMGQPAARATGSSAGMSGGGFSSGTSGGGSYDVARAMPHPATQQQQRYGAYGTAPGAWTAAPRPSAPAAGVTDSSGPSQGPLARHLARVRSERAAAAVPQPEGMLAGTLSGPAAAPFTSAGRHTGDTTPPAPDVGAPQGLVSTASTISNSTCEYSYDSNVSQVPEMEPRRHPVPGRMKKKPVMPQFLREAMAHPEVLATGASSSAHAATGSAVHGSPDSMHTCQTAATDMSVATANSAMPTQGSSMTTGINGLPAAAGQSSVMRAGSITPTSLMPAQALDTIPEGHDGSHTPTKRGAVVEAAMPAGRDAAAAEHLSAAQLGMHMPGGGMQSMQSALEAELQGSSAPTPQQYYEARVPSQPGSMPDANTAQYAAEQTHRLQAEAQAAAYAQQGTAWPHAQRATDAVSAGPGGWVADLQQQQDVRHGMASQQHPSTGQSFDFTPAPAQQQHVWPAAPPSLPSYPAVPDQYRPLPEHSDPLRSSVAERARMFSQMIQQRQLSPGMPPGMGGVRAATAAPAPTGRQLTRSFTTGAAMPGPQHHPPWQAAGPGQTMPVPSPAAYASGLPNAAPHTGVGNAAVPAASSVASYSPAGMASVNPSPGLVAGRAGLSPMRGTASPAGLRPEDSAQHMAGRAYANAGPGPYHPYTAGAMQQPSAMSEGHYAAQYGMPRARSVSPPVAAMQQPAVVMPVVDTARVAWLPGLGGAPINNAAANSDAQLQSAQRMLMRNATMPVGNPASLPQRRPPVSPSRDPSPEAAAATVRFQIRTATQKDEPAWAPPGVSAEVVNRQRSVSPPQGLPQQFGRNDASQHKPMQHRDAQVSPRLMRLAPQQFTAGTAQDVSAVEASFDGMLMSDRRPQQVAAAKTATMVDIPRNIPGLSQQQAPVTTAPMPQPGTLKANSAAAGTDGAGTTPLASQAGSRAGTPPPPPPGPPPPAPVLGMHTPIVVKKSNAADSAASGSVGSNASPAPAGAYESLVESIKALGATGEHRAHLLSLSKSKAKRGAKGQAHVGGKVPAAPALQSENSAASSGHSSAHSLLSQRDMAVSQQRAQAQAQQFMDRLRCVIPAEAQGYEDTEDDDDEFDN